jgi:hypothetical protein
MNGFFEKSHNFGTVAIGGEILLAAVEEGLFCSLEYRMRYCGFIP